MIPERVYMQPPSPRLASPGVVWQVSRRLTRRIKAELAYKNYGYVKIAVQTYRYLLGKSAAEESPFTFSYFAKELIEEPDAVVRRGGQALMT